MNLDSDKLRFRLRLFLFFQDIQRAFFTAFFTGHMLSFVPCVFWPNACPMSPPTVAGIETLKLGRNIVTL